MVMLVVDIALTQSEAAFDMVEIIKGRDDKRRYFMKLLKHGWEDLLLTLAKYTNAEERKNWLIGFLLGYLNRLFTRCFLGSQFTGVFRRLDSNHECSKQIPVVK
jgi:hypothetical protein